MIPSHHIPNIRYGSSQSMVLSRLSLIPFHLATMAVKGFEPPCGLPAPYESDALPVEPHCRDLINSACGGN